MYRPPPSPKHRPAGSPQWETWFLSICGPLLILVGLLLLLWSRSPAQPGPAADHPREDLRVVEIRQDPS